MSEQAQEWRKRKTLPVGSAITRVWQIETTSGKVIAEALTEADADAIIRDHKLVKIFEPQWSDAFDDAFAPHRFKGYISRDEWQKRAEAAEADSAHWRALSEQLAICVLESGEYAEGSPRKFRKIEALAAFDAANTEASNT